MAEIRHFYLPLTITPHNMGMANHDDDRPSRIDFNEIDTATYVAAKIFGAVALPPGTPSAKAAFIEAAANFATMLDGAENFIIGAGGAGGPLFELTRAERQRQIDADNLDYLISVTEEVEQRRLEREREEWSRTEHDFAGAKLTGAEWADLGEELKRDGDLRNWLVTQMMRDGKTRDQAEHKADEMADVYDALSKPPTQRTQAERDAVAHAGHDPDYQRYTARLAEMRTQASPTPAPEVGRSDRVASVDTGADLFASAPDLTAHHQAALTATMPLDAPPSDHPTLPTTSPPAPATMAGLEL